MHWEADAKEALKQVPVFVRPLAKRKIEDKVRAEGSSTVTLADFQEARARFEAVRGGRSTKELAGMMPQDNRAGADMVVIESCRHELAGCPNALIDVALWRGQLETWLAREEISERLRGKISDNRVLFHHKLKIAISGCPNGCARPQIADLALVGAVRPGFDPELCTSCGKCVAACPDGAISLGETALLDQAACQGCLACSRACDFQAVTLGRPFARVFMGGKLGRHPHLADFAGRVREPAEAVAIFSDAVERFLAQGADNQRFSAWWAQDRMRNIEKPAA